MCLVNTLEEKNVPAAFFCTLSYVKTDTTAECKIPMSVFDALARVLLPDITAFFESEEGKKEYAEYVKATEEIKQKKPDK